MSGMLVLGGEGMLGHAIFCGLRSQFHGVRCTIRGNLTASPLATDDRIEGCVFQGVDATDLRAIERLILDTRPAAIVNCIGIVKPRNGDYHNKMQVNALLPRSLARVCMSSETRLIHFSTDGVFSGKRGFYAESDVPDPPDTYGHSKYLGEVSGEGILTVRASFVGLGPKGGRGLLRWLLGQGGGTVRGYSRAFFFGISCERMAELVGLILGKHPCMSGIYHVAGPRTSKRDVLICLAEAFGVKVRILDDTSVQYDRSLIDSRFRSATGTVSLDWQQMADQLASRYRQSLGRSAAHD